MPSPAPPVGERAFPPLCLGADLTNPSHLIPDVWRNLSIRVIKRLKIVDWRLRLVCIFFPTGFVGLTVFLAIDWACGLVDRHVEAYVGCWPPGGASLFHMNDLVPIFNSNIFKFLLLFIYLGPQLRFPRFDKSHVSNLLPAADLRCLSTAPPRPPALYLALSSGHFPPRSLTFPHPPSPPPVCYPMVHMEPSPSHLRDERWGGGRAVLPK